jgi:hypothetical protein
MSKADQFREYAEEAMQWARRSKTENEKQALVELARTWTQAAQRSDGRKLGSLFAGSLERFKHLGHVAHFPESICHASSDRRGDFERRMDANETARK